MSIVDNAVYRGGQRIASPATLEETYRLLARLRTEDPRCTEAGEHCVLVWIGL